MQKLILSILALIVFVISVFSYIQYARNNRIWPFNSGLTRFLPEGTKQLAYKITNPKEKTIITHYYKLNVYSKHGQERFGLLLS